MSQLFMSCSTFIRIVLSSSWRQVFRSFWSAPAGLVVLYASKMPWFWDLPSSSTSRDSFLCWVEAPIPWISHFPLSRFTLSWWWSNFCRDFMRKTAWEINCFWEFPHLKISWVYLHTQLIVSLGIVLLIHNNFPPNLEGISSLYSILGINLRDQDLFYFLIMEDFTIFSLSLNF